MTVYQAGTQQSQFKKRCSDALRCICWQRGDRHVFVDNKGPYCIIIDRESVKVDFEDVGISTSTIEAVWLEDDCIPIEKGSTLTSSGYQYKVKESPVDNHDGRYSAKLQLKCKC